MVETYTAQQVRDAEGPLLAAGVPLMQRAAGALAELVRTELLARSESSAAQGLPDAGRTGRLQAERRGVEGAPAEVGRFEPLPAERRGAAGALPDAVRAEPPRAGRRDPGDAPPDPGRSELGPEPGLGTGALAGRTVLLLVGAGNNGGDALYAGARLAADGARVLALPVGGRVHEEGLAALLAVGGETADAAGWRPEAPVDAVVDGILGTGTAHDPALRGTAREVVEALNEQWRAHPERRPLVVAVDLPSGVHPDTGAVPDPTVLRADLTLTFGGVKTGLLRAPAAGYAGEIRLAEIGLGQALRAQDASPPRSAPSP